MTYIENIFICMVSPLLVAALCMGRRQLRFRLRIRENQKKGGADKPNRHEQEEKSQ